MHIAHRFTFMLIALCQPKLSFLFPTKVGTQLLTVKFSFLPQTYFDQSVKNLLPNLYTETWKLTFVIWSIVLGNQLSPKEIWERSWQLIIYLYPLVSNESFYFPLIFPFNFDSSVLYSSSFFLHYILSLPSSLIKLIIITSIF